MSNQKSCCGVVEEARMQVHERRAQKPQPWIVLKLAVFLTIALNGYAAYVYVGIFCRDMIVRNSSALGNQTIGIVFLTIFCIFFFMVSWSYIRVVTTSPGHAVCFVEKTEKPGQQPMCQLSSTPGDTPGMSYELLSPQVDPSHNGSHDSDIRTTRDDQDDILQPSSTVGNNHSVTPSAPPPAAPQGTTFQAPPQHQSTNTPEGARITDTDTQTPPITNPSVLPSYTTPHQNSFNSPQLAFPRQPLLRLLPEQRYCSKDKIIKPPRAHHCRACGTCILKYDHHCPWIGHCVGAFNHKFFVNFVQWASILAFWMFATLLGLVVKSQRRSAPPNLNPQEIVVVALSGFFGIFCALMFMTHVHLIIMNQTTVESMAFRTMKDREQVALAKDHGLCDISAKRQIKQYWDNEWGRIGKEGNIWWLGSKRENWESVMGKNVWWWFLPVGYGLQDGLNYPKNPRFDKQGILRRRREWPSDL